ncbi:probable ATP-dependent RNA helicase DDX28 [Culicoides brevitarsis]|uniref:probable ATP-dependent RNA helicase DDX28 n=1 Tax=Culicoides brevitarsis TaxID=469753 RepID=UPI00307B6490
MLQRTYRQLISRRFLSTSSIVLCNKNVVQREPIITCKRPEFDLYSDDKIPGNKSFKSIPLASEKWTHPKSASAGDFFIIHPHKPRTPYEDSNFEKWGAEFKKFDFDEILLENLANNELSRSTWVQNQAIPLILNNQHVLIAAETGCGKTLAYLLPLIQRLIKTKERLGERPFNSPLLLLLTPGRELAEQIETVAREMTKGTDLKVKLILGGHTKQLMMNPTFEDMDILIGSVGGISKLTTSKILRMNHCRHVVLDEADTLLDDSFLNKMQWFLNKFPFHKNHLQDLSDQIIGCQLILASATMPHNTNEVLQSVINPETIVRVVSPNLHRLMTHVPQRFLRISKMNRSPQLLSIVKSDLKSGRPVMIFANESATSDYISIFLNNNGINCINLHGQMLQKIRVGRFQQFQQGEVNVISTTDVASRGLDTTRVKHVVNFDFPFYISDYIHRCGRVGRVGSAENCYITNFVSNAATINLVNRIEHAARTGQELENVNANIKGQIQERIKRQIENISAR